MRNADSRIEKLNRRQHSPANHPFSFRPSIQKVGCGGMAGILAIRKGCALLIQSTRAGRIARRISMCSAEIIEFLKRKWAEELDYRWIKELWAHDGNRIAGRFKRPTTWHDYSGIVNRSYVTELGI